MKILSMPKGGTATTHIYDNGTQIVAFSNGVYKMLAAYTLTGGLTFGAANISMVTPATNDSCNTAVTSLPIDVTGYNVLKIATDLFGTLAIDISGVTGNQYVYLSAYKGGGTSNYHIAFGTSSAQADFFSASTSQYDSGARAALTTCLVTEIWFE